MNYLILGIAIILIILMMGTKKREGYTLAPKNAICPPGQRIDNLDQCKKAAFELQAKGLIGPPIGLTHRASSPTANVDQGSWAHNMKASDSNVPYQHNYDTSRYDKGCWVSTYRNPTSNHLYLNVSPTSQGKHADSFHQNICGSGSEDYDLKAKNTNCEPGKDITTQAECQKAIREIGLKYDPWWTGNHGDIPRGCTWTDAVLNNTSRGSLSHWNAWTSSAGKPRYDLHPICTKKAVPPGSRAVDLGVTPSKKPLDLCEGDCDNDSDCKGDLVCWQQDYQLFPNKQCSGIKSGDHDYCVKANTGNEVEIKVGKSSEVDRLRKWDGKKKNISLPVPCISFPLDPSKRTNQQYPTSVKNTQNSVWPDRFHLNVESRDLEVTRMDAYGHGWGQDLVLVGKNDGKGCSVPSLESGPCKEDDGYDHGGADITSLQNIASSSACCDKCKENPDCKSWTWGKDGGPWSKTCWIKNKQFGSSGKRRKKPGLISGQPPKRPPSIPPPKSGRVTNPDCVRYNWSDWSPCNRMCAGGTQTRIRTNNGFCIEGGKVAYFDSEQRACNTQQCPRGPTGQQGELGLGGPRGILGQKGPTGKSGGGTGFPGSSGVVGGVGGKGSGGFSGPKGEAGFRGEEGKVVSKAQVNNDLLSGIYDELMKIGGVDKEDFSNLKPFNNPNYD